MSDDFAARAAARKGWPARRLSLEESGADDDLSASTSAAQRLEMMWALAMNAWALSGQPMPSYERSQMPGACRRPPQTP